MHHGKRTYEYLNSFFKEQIIETYRSEYNPELEVAFINGRYQLNAGKVNYSFGPLHDAFRKYFRKDPPVMRADSEVLLLGLGAGSVVSILRNELQINNPVTGVEIDPMVIEAAREHFALGKISRLHVVISDAYDFMTDCVNKYDLIVIDLYVDDQVPAKFQTPEFITMVAGCLRPGGKVVFNKLQCASGDQPDVETLTGYFKAIFNTVEVMTVYINKHSPNYFITGKINA